MDEVDSADELVCSMSAFSVSEDSQLGCDEEEIEGLAQPHEQMADESPKDLSCLRLDHMASANTSSVGMMDLPTATNMIRKGCLQISQDTTKHSGVSRNQSTSTMAFSPVSSSSGKLNLTRKSKGSFKEKRPVPVLQRPRATRGKAKHASKASPK